MNSQAAYIDHLRTNLLVSLDGAAKARDSQRWAESMASSSTAAVYGMIADEARSSRAFYLRRAIGFRDALRRISAN